jgi:hypothetical protein
MRETVWNPTPSASLGASAKQGRLFSQSARKRMGHLASAVQREEAGRGRPALHQTAVRN